MLFRSLLLSLKTCNKGSSFLQNGVHTLLSVTQGTLPRGLCPHLQLFPQNFPRSLHLRNSIPTTCHCRMCPRTFYTHPVSSSPSPGHSLTRSHSAFKPCEIQVHCEKFFLRNYLAFTVSTTYLALAYSAFFFFFNTSGILSFFLINLFILFIIFIFGCVVSLLLHTSFSVVAVSGSTLHCGAQASHCGGFSCCEHGL